MATAKKASEKKAAASATAVDSPVAAPVAEAAEPVKKKAAAKKADKPAAAPVAEAPAAEPAKKASKAKAKDAEEAPAKPVSAFMKPLKPSAALGAVVGTKALPRTEVTKKLWAYIKKHKLQDATDRRMINADAKLEVIFKKAQVSMFEMTKLVSAHLK